MSINTLAHVFTPHGNIVYTANDFRQTVRIAVAGTIALFFIHVSMSSV